MWNCLQHLGAAEVTTWIVSVAKHSASWHNHCQQSIACTSCYIAALHAGHNYTAIVFNLFPAESILAQNIPHSEHQAALLLSIVFHYILHNTHLMLAASFFVILSNPWQHGGRLNTS